MPNWVMAVSSFLTLVVAGVAAFFAYKAAHWTKDQAKASQDQAKYAREALEVAQRDSDLANDTSERQRAEADRSYRLLVQAQLDALAPVVLATASLQDPPPSGGPFFLWKRRDMGGVGGVRSEWEPVTEQLEIPHGDKYWFRLRVRLAFRNVSDTVALIDILDSARGTFSNHSERSMPSVVVPPHEERAVTWTRQLSSEALYRDGVVHDPESGSFKMRFEIRDQGLNVRDTYEFVESLGFFSQDGSRLIVKPKQELHWVASVATPVPGRVYERLDD